MLRTIFPFTHFFLNCGSVANLCSIFARKYKEGNLEEGEKIANSQKLFWVHTFIVVPEGTISTPVILNSVLTRGAIKYVPKIGEQKEVGSLYFNIFNTSNFIPKLNLFIK